MRYNFVVMNHIQGTAVDIIPQHEEWTNLENDECRWDRGRRTDDIAVLEWLKSYFSCFGAI